ncbi:hypothetical protein DFH08DRAFT_1001984 [Mycena albidolilacea]|uniref:Uncharacterized protein n=1 Tax=Mycena albidolilacea TaxID=1033008 RepID=A0AAD7A0Y4_9AGAR|nr:hypothetical protein DFH08DRAFT_1001984 [Mycena albidolilacea]
MLFSSPTASVHAAWLDRMDIFFGPRSQDWVIPRAMIKANPGLDVLAVLSNRTGECISSYFFQFGPDIHVFQTPPSVAGVGLDISCSYAIRGAQEPRPRRRRFPFCIPRMFKRWLWVALTSFLHLLCSITTHTHTIGLSFLWETTETTPSILAYNTPPSFMPPPQIAVVSLRRRFWAPVGLPYPRDPERNLWQTRRTIARLPWYTASTLFWKMEPAIRVSTLQAETNLKATLFFCFRSTLIFLAGFESPRSHPGTTSYVPAFVWPNAKSSNIFVNTRTQHLRHPHYWSVWLCASSVARVEPIRLTGLPMLDKSFVWEKPEKIRARTLKFCVPYKRRAQVTRCLQANVSYSFLLPNPVRKWAKVYTAIPFFVSNRNPGLAVDNCRRMYEHQSQPFPAPHRPGRENRQRSEPKLAAESEISLPTHKIRRYDDTAQKPAAQWRKLYELVLMVEPSRLYRSTHLPRRTSHILRLDATGSPNHAVNMSQPDSSILESLSTEASHLDVRISGFGAQKTELSRRFQELSEALPGQLLCKTVSGAVAQKFDALHHEALVLLKKATNLATDATYLESTIEGEMEHAAALKQTAEALRDGEVKVLETRQRQAEETKFQLLKLQEEAQHERDKRNNSFLGISPGTDSTLRAIDAEAGEEFAALTAAQNSLNAVVAQLNRVAQLEQDVSNFYAKAAAQLEPAKALAGNVGGLVNHCSTVGELLAPLVAESSVLPVEHTAQKLAASVLEIQSQLGTTNTLTGLFVTNPESMEAALRVIAASSNASNGEDDDLV